MKRAPSCERRESFVGRLINGEHQEFVLSMDQREILAFDLLHRTESNYPLVSCLEASYGRGPNDL